MRPPFIPTITVNSSAESRIQLTVSPEISTLAASLYLLGESSLPFSKADLSEDNLSMRKPTTTI
jgi:hypothetical protein